LYRKAIDKAWKRSGLAEFPPSWEKDGQNWGNTEILWPTALFERDDPRVAALSEHVRTVFYGGFIEGAIQWHGMPTPAIHPYMGLYTTMSDLGRGMHENVVEDFYWYLLHTTAANAFPEGVFHQYREAWNGTIPHVTGACNYAILLRHMIVHEMGDELHLLSAVPDWWLGEGKEIRIQRAPTHFGEVNLVIRGKKNGVEVKFDPPKRNPPKRIVLTLPQSRPLIGSLDGVEVVQRDAQKKRWDFPTVVAAYKDLNKKKPYYSLTTGKPATCSSVLPTAVNAPVAYVGYPPYSFYAASLANDGHAEDTERYWATSLQHYPGPAWWQVDLEKPTAVGRVVVVGYFGDARSYGFTVETSLDAEKWDMVADRRDNKWISTPK
ncbi:hypothetical protein LCGC14_2939890, partial [marine sediment metagenome]